MTTITLSYLFISIAIVVVVAGTLYRNGREFLVDCFEGNEPLADAINRMLVVGFIVTKASYDVVSRIRRASRFTAPWIRTAGHENWIRVHRAWSVSYTHLTLPTKRIV